MTIPTVISIGFIAYGISQPLIVYIALRAHRNKEKRDRLRKLEGSQRENEILKWNQKSLPEAKV